jgi:hypothetical protein
MKKKIGTLLDEEILSKAKKRAQRDGRALADIIQDALNRYLHESGPTEDAVRAAERFCSHGATLRLDDVDEILREDILAVP